MAAEGEFSLIEAFLSRFGRPVARVGPGDDCAVLSPGKGELCVTCDAVVEGVHFQLPAFSLEDVGHKALAVNLSDLAAMSARPTWALCAVAMPRGYGTREVLALAGGMSKLAARHRVSLVGGNFTRASELSLTLTLAGTVPAGRALLRSGARAGDLLYVSGTLGDARLGLADLAAGRRTSPLARRQRRPEPRLELGLLARGFARAAIDLSDGLAQDLLHLCRASGVGAEVTLSALPLSPAAVRACGSAQRAREEAARGGEDYELLLALPPRRAGAFEAACAEGKHRVTRIGRLIAAPGVQLLGGRPGERFPGHDHFRLPERASN